MCHNKTAYLTQISSRNFCYLLVRLCDEFLRCWKFRKQKWNFFPFLLSFRYAKIFILNLWGQDDSNFITHDSVTDLVYQKFRNLEWKIFISILKTIFNSRNVWLFSKRSDLILKYNYLINIFQVSFLPQT